VFGRFSLDDDAKGTSLEPACASVERKRATLIELLASINNFLEAEMIEADAEVARDPSLKHWSMATVEEKIFAADQSQLLEVAKYLFFVYLCAPSHLASLEKFRRLIILANDLLQQMA
jgi:hypothetical protein